MKILSIIFIIISLWLWQDTGKVSICSWNLKDFGKTKSDTELQFIAATVKDFDILAIQEVVAGEGGAQAVARLSAELNRTGIAWDYTISDPTSSSSPYDRERYAFFWKKGKITKTGDAWLEKQFSQQINREPFLATFRKDKKVFTLVNFHAISKARQPETEIKYLKSLSAEYPTLNLIFLGDFNLSSTHSVFNPLKALGYLPVFENQKTSLRDKCLADGCLASEYDHIFVNDKKNSVINQGVIHFYKSFSTLQEAKQISDHIPIFVVLETN